ncbi:hypothetical protein L208DRAFT_1399110 [Tricholoma matsutake]|nr:hypothetical protein L208DRAFT_1399110 [Tricholoma matsutake 945]
MTNFVRLLGFTEIVAADGQTPAKRGRGRPKGSKNKRTAASSSAPAAESSTPSIPRKRGRPPKVNLRSINLLHPPDHPFDQSFAAGEDRRRWYG